MNPLELPIPEGNIDIKVRTLARDLAYGAISGDWQPTFNVVLNGNIILNTTDKNRRDTPNGELFKAKWDGQNTDTLVRWLEIFQYLHVTTSQNTPGARYHTLTERAFALLTEPAQTPQIFVSYRRKESTTFALLIEARLKLQGVHTAFVDKSIPAGQPWNSILEEKIRESTVFICIIAPETLNNVNYG